MSKSEPASQRITCPVCNAPPHVPCATELNAPHVQRVLASLKIPEERD